MQTGFSMTLRQWYANLMSHFRPGSPCPKALPRAKAQERTFTFHLESGPVKVQAHTKGEARARLKRLLGLERLPAGIGAPNLRRQAG